MILSRLLPNTATFRRICAFAVLAIVAAVFAGCVDQFHYDNKSRPEWEVNRLKDVLAKSQGQPEAFSADTEKVVGGLMLTEDPDTGEIIVEPKGCNRTVYRYLNTRERLCFYPYIVANGAEKSLHLKISYHGYEWITPRRIEMYADGKKLEFEVGSRIEADVDSGLWEYVADDLSLKWREMVVRTAAGADEVTIYLVGDATRPEWLLKGDFVDNFDYIIRYWDRLNGKAPL